MADMASIANIGAFRPKGTTGVFCGPLGTALPTDAETELNAALNGLGHAGEDGLTFPSERSSDDVRNWGGELVKSLQTEFNQTFTVALIESMNIDVLKVVYGDDNVTGDSTAASVKINSKVLPHKTWVFEGRDGDALLRLCVPDGQVTEVGEPSLVHSGVTQFELTIRAFADANGDNAFIYTSNTAAPNGSGNGSGGGGA